MVSLTFSSNVTHFLEGKVELINELTKQIKKHIVDKALRHGSTCDFYLECQKKDQCLYFLTLVCITQTGTVLFVNIKYELLIVRLSKGYGYVLQLEFILIYNIQLITLHKHIP